MKTKCTCYRMVDAKECPNQAKFEIRFEGKHIGYACRVHSRAYGEKALFKLVSFLDEVVK